MKTEWEIKEKLQSIQEYINTVPKRNILTENERYAFVGSNAAAQILEWVLEIRKCGNYGIL